LHFVSNYNLTEFTYALLNGRVFWEAGPNAEILRYTGIPIMGNDLCSASFKDARIAPKLKSPFGVLDDTQICAGGISQRDACYGDGGSPL
jgi:Trypsin